MLYVLIKLIKLTVVMFIAFTLPWFGLISLIMWDSYYISECVKMIDIVLGS